MSSKYTGKPSSSTQSLHEKMGTSGEGNKFQCKLVGITDVASPEGGEMCAEALKKLKVQSKKKGQHKEKVTLAITLEGIRIEDETTQKVQHMHPVKRISFVTPDPDDKKIFGYVCSQPDCPTGYTFYALKSENAKVIIDAIIELFEVSVTLRQRAGSAKEQVTRNSSNENRTELQEMRARLSNLQAQLREKGDQLREKEGINVNLQTRLNTKNQQLEEKIRQEENLYQKLRAMEEQISQSQAQLRERESEKANLLKERDRQNGNLRAMHQLKTKMQEQLDRKEQKLVESELRLREMNQQLRDLQAQIKEKDRATFALQERLGITVQQVGELEEQLTRKDREKNELERSLSTAQQILRDNQAQRSPDWVIPRNQIQLTTNSLGRGAWGEVQGRFCGCVVAVKTIHDLILSPHNRRLFEREMDIASRCRHPCLLQFIGATNDDHTPLFLTEVMETSLRTLLQERSLSQTEIIVIALDVARGLNYLHQKRPIPILHRDISSANVLLWRQGTQWRAKVSDYGTANFKKQTMTVAPGALIYSAPEARATNQTVQVDVYSFGVLLCEMSIRELPDPERREQQVAMVANNVLRALIRGCLETNPQARPTMEEIIDEIEPEAQGTF